MNPVGRWRIIEMDLWDRKAIELLGPGNIAFRLDPDLPRHGSKAAFT